VPLIGFDPRDLLYGHYLLAQFDWDWEREPMAPNTYQEVDGAGCVLADVPKPRLRFLAGWTAGDPVDPACRLVMIGRGWPRDGRRPPRFTPASLDQEGAGVRFYIPEDRGSEFENLIRDRPGALTADLAVRVDGNVAIRALRIDGKPIGR
jgi:GDYXXLXY protein